MYSNNNTEGRWGRCRCISESDRPVYLRARYFYLELIPRRRAPEAPSPSPLREPTRSGPRSRAWRADRRGCRRSTGTRRRSRASRGATCRPAPRCVFPYADITPQPGTDPLLLPLGGTGDIAEDAVIPTFQLGWQVNERVWLGVSVNAPFGLSTHAPDTTASQLYGRKSEAVSFSLSPTVGYKVNDWLSVGAAVQLLYFECEADRRGHAAAGFARQRDHLRRLRGRLFARRHDHAGQGHHDRHRVSVADRDRPGGRLHLPTAHFAGQTLRRRDDAHASRDADGQPRAGGEREHQGVRHLRVHRVGHVRLVSGHRRTFPSACRPSPTGTTTATTSRSAASTRSMTS